MGFEDGVYSMLDEVAGLHTKECRRDRDSDGEEFYGFYGNDIGICAMFRRSDNTVTVSKYDQWADKHTFIAIYGDVMK